MNRPKIILIIAPTPQPNKEYMNRSKKLSCPHLGMGYIAAVLKENGFNVTVVDLLMNGTEMKLLKEILEQQGSLLIGITSTTESFNNAVRIARLCKKANPTVRTILGGPHVTFMDLETLADLSVDIVVRDEGEYSMLEIAMHFAFGYKKLDEINGISFRDNNSKIIRNPSRQFLYHLDELPFPSRELFTESTYKIFNGLITARGCTGKCFFCSAGALSKGRYRCRSVLSVADEFVFLNNLKVKFITVVDDNLTVNAKRIENLCELLMLLNINVQFSIESRIDTINKKTLLKLKEAGCKSIQFGVESGNQLVLDSIDKGISIDQINNVMEWSHEIGIQAVCSIMLGHPEDTWEIAQRTLKFAWELQNKYGAFSFFCIATPLPGTKLYRDHEKYGLVFHSQNFDNYTFLSPVCSTRYLTIDQIRDLLLQGYTISATNKAFKNELSV